MASCALQLPAGHVECRFMAGVRGTGAGTSHQVLLLDRPGMVRQASFGESSVKSNMVAGMALVVAIVLCLVGWFVAPSLQVAERTVNQEAGMIVTKARRVLHEYDPWLTYRTVMVDMAEADELDLGDPTDLSEEAADAYQQYHSAAWEAYQPKDWPTGDQVRERPRNASPRYGNIAGDISNATKGMDQLVAANNKVLGEALTIVDEALRVSVGEASARDHAEANRLKGIILYHQGQAKQMEATAVRRGALRQRHALSALAGELPVLTATSGMVAQSGIDEQIESLQTRAGEVEDLIAADRSRLAELESTIQRLTGELEAAQAQADAARAKMDELRAQGVDLTDPNGAEVFDELYTASDVTYRNALRRVRELKFSTRAEGDSAQHGLAHFEDQRDVVAAQMDSRQKALDDLRSDIARLDGIKAVYVAAEGNAKDRLEKIRGEAQTAHEALTAVADAAQALEEEAIGLYGKSLSAIKAANRGATSWVQEGGRAAQNLNQEARGRSAYNARSQDGWLPAYIKAQEADVHLAIAWIHTERYRAGLQDAQVLAGVQESLGLGEVDREAIEAVAGQAQEDGVEAVRSAMASLDAAHRGTGKQWTIVAQQAGTVYLMNLLGYDYKNDAINAYRNAVNGRDDKTVAQPFVARLNQLES